MRSYSDACACSPIVPVGASAASRGPWSRSSPTVSPACGTGRPARSTHLRRCADAVVDQFHRLYYHSDTTWQQTWYRGHATWKCPLDLWIYQELVSELRPDLIVETGTAYGGSGLFLADLCDVAGRGQVVTIDIRERARDVEHARLTKLVGSSIDGAVFDRVAAMAADASTVLVILDADHARDHVVAEMRLWAPLVTAGSYIVVEDTNVNGHPVFPGFGPGPAEAVAAFLGETDAFVIDRSREKFLMTWNGGGFLRRVAER